MFHVSEGDVQSTRNVELHQRQPMENWQVGERKLDSHDTLHLRIRDIHWLYMNCIYHVQFNSSWQEPSRLVTSTVTGFAPNFNNHHITYTRCFISFSNSFYSSICFSNLQMSTRNSSARDGKFWSAIEPDQKWRAWVFLQWHPSSGLCDLR